MRCRACGTRAGAAYRKDGATLGLLGPKAIRNIPDLLRYEPGFSIDLLFDLAFPIGEYDDDQPLNLGQNSSGFSKLRQGCRVTAKQRCALHEGKG